MYTHPASSLFFFFNDTATTEIYTLSLHDALPICLLLELGAELESRDLATERLTEAELEALIDQRDYKEFLNPRNELDRKSTRLNSSHLVISYAVFCLKKKKNTHSKSYCTV